MSGTRASPLAAEGSGLTLLCVTVTAGYWPDADAQALTPALVRSLGCSQESVFNGSQVTSRELGAHTHCPSSTLRGPQGSVAPAMDMCQAGVLFPPGCCPGESEVRTEVAASKQC